jgi:hypothetical protein
MLFYIPEASFIAPILEQNHVTRTDIEKYQHYLLYEKFLPDWFVANGNRSKYSLQNLGDFTVVDETYSKLGENWGAE